MPRLGIRPSVGLGVISLLFVAMGGLVTLEVRIGQGWEQTLSEARERSREMARVHRERPSVTGDAYQGRAFDHYTRALDLISPWKADEVVRARRAETPEERALRERLLVEGQAALAELQAGARAQDATREMNWPQPRYDTVKLLRVRHLQFLVQAQAREYLAEGSDSDAVELLLHGWQLAVDLTRGPLLVEEMIGLAALHPPLLIDGLADGTFQNLSSSARRELLVGLEGLRVQLPWEVQSLESDHALTTERLHAEILDPQVLFTSSSLPTFIAQPLRAYQANKHTLRHRELLLALGARRKGDGAEGLVDQLEWLQDLYRDEPEYGDSPFRAPVTSALRSRAYSLGRFYLVMHAFGDDPLTGDPFLSSLLREDQLPGRVRTWLDHDAFEGLELLVHRGEDD